MTDQTSGAGTVDPRMKQLRAAVLAVSVLDDVDLTPRAAGVRLDGPRPVLVGWDELAAVVGDHDPTGAVGRRRLSIALALRRTVAEAGRGAAVLLRPRARLLALPLDHAAHPGSPWVLDVQLGLAVTCGVGLTGVSSDPDEVVPLPPGVAAAAGLPLREWWPDLVQHAEDMGDLAVRRLERDRVTRAAGTTSVRVGATDRQSVVRPVGGVDALTLLTTTAVRRHLAGGDSTGMRAVAVPMRSRAWYDLARVDPAYVGAAWSATSPWDRGLPRPVLVTADEVSLPLGGGDPVSASLADPARSSRFHRDVRYR